MSVQQAERSRSGVQSAPEAVARGANKLLLVLFWLYAAGAFVFLLAGLLPAIAAAADSFHNDLHAYAERGGIFAGIAENVGVASHGSEALPYTVFAYLFSAVNLALGVLLIKLRPHGRTARLLAIGLIGTAAVFNLQAHTGLVVLPPIRTFHDGLHLVAGVAYVLALLLFPDGRFVPRWSQLHWWQWPLRAAYLVGLAVLALLVVQDFHGGNPTSWVVFFGLVIPVAGLISQISRYRHAQSPVECQQAKVLMWTLSGAFAAALVMLALGMTGEGSSQTRRYEFTTPSSGVYYFRCDPHPGTMRGTVHIVEGGDADRVVEITAENDRFDTTALTLPAGERAVIRLTNKDRDAHNIAIYEERFSDPVFVGPLFSGEDLTVFAFFLFPALFIVIPIALVAVLVRYRLWDIERVINRALVYGILSGVLGAVYFGIVILLGNIARSVTGQQENSAVIAVSTLAVAALFTPARHRVQEFIDQRFYRRKYDAARTLEAFSARLRDHIDLDALTRELLDVVDQTMQPTSVSLWLRSPETAPSGVHNGHRDGETPSVETRLIDHEPGERVLRNDSGTGAR